MNDLKEIFILLAYLTAVLAWFVIVSFFGLQKFSYRRYYIFVVSPIIGIIGVGFLYPLHFLFFFVSALNGWVAEFLLGWFNKRVFGLPLWEYKLLPVWGGLVSPLSLPYWGIAGIVFVTLYKMMLYAITQSFI